MGEKKKKKSLLGLALSLPGRVWKLIKLIILIVVIVALIIGYSGAKTLNGFRKGAVEQSEYLYVDTVNKTANFTLTIENRGFLPIEIKIEFKLDLGISTEIEGGGKAVVYFYKTVEFDIKGGESQTKNIVFGPMSDEIIAKIEDGKKVYYTPSVKATYSWFIKIKDTTLDKEELIVVKQNFPPEIKDIKITPEPVFTNTLTHIQLNVSDPENDTLYYNYTMNGNPLNVPINATSFQWKAPDVAGKNILGVEVSDGKNTVKKTKEIVVMRPLFLVINTTVNYKESKVNVWVNSSKSLSSVPDVFYFRSGEQKTNLTVVPQSAENTSFKGEFNFTPGQYFIEAQAQDPENPDYVAKEHSELKIEKITTENKRAKVETTNVTIEINTKEELADVNFSIFEFTENPVNESQVDDKNLYSLKKFLRIDTEEILKENLSWALVNITYSDSDLPARTDETNIALYYWNETEGKWQLVKVEYVDPVNNYFLANITHFSIYGGFSTNRAPFVDAGDDLVVERGEKVKFVTYFEDDFGDEMVRCEWDFDGDGVYDYSSNESTEANWTFEKEGVYNVTVRITDKGGAQGFDTIFVTVEKKKGTGLEALAEMPAFEGASLLTTLILVAGVLGLYKKKR